MICPCCSGKKYEACCKPCHDGRISAPTALALMRSRYSAYALSKVSYIIETTHSTSPYFEKDRKKWEQAILEFCHTTHFTKLEILGYGEDWVHFVAHLRQKEPFLLDEKSTFLKEGDKWFYFRADFKKT